MSLAKTHSSESLIIKAEDYPETLTNVPLDLEEEEPVEPLKKCRISDFLAVAVVVCNFVLIGNKIASYS
jgi:hypothetical protein